MRTWHVYARHHNFGDYALGLGLRNIFEAYFPRPMIFELVDVHSLVFDAATVARLNASAQLMLVGGGGLIRGRGDQWLFKLPAAQLLDIAVPIVCYGLGYNNFPSEPEVGPQVIENLRALQAQALGFSVRNDGTQERLARLGFEAPEVPDPGFFVAGDYPRPPVPQPYVVVQLAYAIPGIREFSEVALVAALVPVIKFLRRRGYSVVLAPHVETDSRPTNLLLEALGHPAGVSTWPWHHLMRDENTREGLAYYQHAQFVIGMRGHAQICPIGLGVPVITIASHAKHTGLLAHLNLPSYAVGAAEPHAGDRLIEFVQVVEAERAALVERYLASLAGLRAAAKSYIEHLGAAFASRPD